MNFVKQLFLLAAMALVAASVGAQDFGFEDPESSASVTPSGEPSLSFSGQVDFAGRVFINNDNLMSSPVQTPSSVVARVAGGSSAADLSLALRLSPEILASNPGRVIDEAVLRTYLGDRLELTVGLAKVTWGKGDSLRVLDVVNPQDYTDFINTDLEDRKIPQGLFKADLRTTETGKLEAVYVPFFEADTLPLEGTWAPKAFKDMRTQVSNGFYYGDTPSLSGGRGNGVFALVYNSLYPSMRTLAIAQIMAKNGVNETIATSILDTNVGGSLDSLKIQVVAAAAAQARSQVDVLMGNLLVFPDTKTLAWGQGGLRLTESLGGIDFGLQYYTGYLRTPVYDADPVKLAATQHLAVDYNRYHQAGVDAAFVLADFNLRLEAAYHLTADQAGTDPLVRNPYASGTVGIDRTFSGISVNVQALGTWNQGLSGANGVYDVQKGAQEVSAVVAGQLGYKFANDRVEVTMAGSTNLPDLDWLVMPGLTFYPVDDVTLNLGGKVFGGKAEGQLGQYASKSFAEATASYSF